LDPDVIIQGEVRDEETAQLAVKAAETGHLVIATLHTNSIQSSIERLEYLGIERHALKYLLRSVLVQNLIRVLCKRCHGEGCLSCQQTGFVSRTIVSECAYFPDEKAVDDLLEGGRSWPLLIEDAISKYREGLTTRSELERVFAEEARPYLADGADHAAPAGQEPGKVAA
jgi:general secretion pathway protein E